MRQASVFVADDWTTSIGGKTSISGVYATDIYIPMEPYFAVQLVFVFLIETDPNDPFQTLVLQVKLPGGEPKSMALPLHTFRDGVSDQVKWCLKYPLLYPTPVLRPGQIEAKVIHERGEIICSAAPFIVLRPPAGAPSTS
jgi:hypothetical protein